MATAGIDISGPDRSDPPRRWPRTTAAALATLAIVGGLALRVFAPSPLWLDEALSVNIAGLGFADMVESLRHDGHPSLYYLLLGWWMDIFGESDAAVRSLSGVLSLLVVPVVWAIGRRLEPGVGAVAALFALTSPFLLRYGTEARMYALVVLLVALGWWAVIRAYERTSWWHLVVVVAVTAALVHTHYWAIWVIGAALLLLGWRGLRHTDERRTALAVAGAIVVGATTFVAWLGVFIDQMTSTGTPWADRARPAEIVIETAQALGGSGRFEAESVGVLMGVLVALGVTAVAIGRRPLVLDRPRGPIVTSGIAMISLTLVLGGAVAFATAGAFEARYAAVVVAFVLVLAARGAAAPPDPVAPALVALVVVAGLLVGFDNARRDRTQGEEIATAIDESAGAGDVVVFCPDQLGPAAVRSLDHDGDRLAYPSGDGTFIDWADYLDRITATDPVAFAEAADRAAGSADVWLVAAFTYRGFEGRCEGIAETLGSRRTATTVVTARPVFEPMALIRYEAPA